MNQQRDFNRGVEQWSPLGGRRSWSEEEEKANARKLTAEAKLTEEKHFMIKMKRWGQGAIGLSLIEAVTVLVYLAIQNT